MYIELDSVYTDENNKYKMVLPKNTEKLQKPNLKTGNISLKYNYDKQGKSFISVKFTKIYKKNIFFLKLLDD